MSRDDWIFILETQVKSHYQTNIVCPVWILMYFPPLNYLKAKVFTLLLSLALSSIHIGNPNQFELSSSKEKKVSVKLNSPIVICIFCFDCILILIFANQNINFFPRQRDWEKRPWSRDEEFRLPAKNSEVGLLYFVVSWQPFWRILRWFWIDFYNIYASLFWCFEWHHFFFYLLPILWFQEHQKNST